jgi:hypothetical protein
MAGSFSRITTEAAGQPNFALLPGITTAAAIRRTAREDGYRAANGKGFRLVSAGQKYRCHRGFFG